MAASLRPRGTLVLDFFNPNYVINTLVPFEEKEIEGVVFKIRKELVEGHIVKSIEVHDQGEVFSFEENVKAITKEEFEEYFKLAGLHLENVYGSYKFEPYSPDKSERMIFIAKK